MNQKGKIFIIYNEQRGHIVVIILEISIYYCNMNVEYRTFSIVTTPNLEETVENQSH